jgi:hypothetical protein
MCPFPCKSLENGLSRESTGRGFVAGKGRGVRGEGLEVLANEKQGGDIRLSLQLEPAAFRKLTHIKELESKWGLSNSLLRLHHALSYRCI